MRDKESQMVPEMMLKLRTEQDLIFDKLWRLTPAAMPYGNNFLPPTEIRHVALISKFAMIEYSSVIDQNLMNISVDQFILRMWKFA